MVTRPGRSGTIGVLDDAWITRTRSKTLCRDVIHSLQCVGGLFHGIQQSAQSSMSPGDRSFLRVRAAVALLLLMCGLGSAVALAWTHIQIGKAERGRPRLRERAPNDAPSLYPYLVYLPPAYEQKEAWPLLLFLHGRGEEGEDDLETVKRHGPPKLIKEGKHFPFIVVSPQCPEGRSWRPAKLGALLDKLIATFKIDKDRIYVTGLSMGGGGTWAFGAFAPQRLAAIVPISNGGNVSLAPRLEDLPVWTFCGALDPTIASARKMVEALRAQGNDAKLTIYPRSGHDAWTETYSNPAVYDWLLKQRRSHKRGQ
jgi:poly(3-hydroxybutyrate) depolymerase